MPLVLCFVLAACGGPGTVVVDGDFSAPQSQPGNAPTGYRLLLTLPGLNGMAAPLLARSVQDYCDELNIEVIVHDSAGDAAAQYAEIETFITAGGNAILCWPVEPAGVDVYLESARGRGIIALAFGEKQPGADATLVCDGWGATLAGAAAPFVEENMRWSGTALLLEDTGPTALPGFAAAAATKLAELDPELEVVRETPDGADAVANILEENPDVRLVLCGSFELAALVFGTLAIPANVFIGGPAAPGEGGALSAAVEMDFTQAGRDWVDMAVAAIEGGAAADKTIDVALIQLAEPEDDSTT